MLQALLSPVCIALGAVEAMQLINPHVEFLLTLFCVASLHTCAETVVCDTYSVRESLQSLFSWCYIVNKNMHANQAWLHGMEAHHTM